MIRFDTVSGLFSRGRAEGAEKSDDSREGAKARKKIFQTYSFFKEPGFRRQKLKLVPAKAPAILRITELCPF
jgi:hypothetical protein